MAADIFGILEVDSEPRKINKNRYKIGFLGSAGKIEPRWYSAFGNKEEVGGYIKKLEDARDKKRKVKFTYTCRGKHCNVEEFLDWDYKEVYRPTGFQTLEELKGWLGQTFSDDLSDGDIEKIVEEAGLMIEDAKSKTKDIKTLYVEYYNTDQDVDEFAAEFFFAVGELLKGRGLKK